MVKSLLCVSYLRSAEPFSGNTVILNQQLSQPWFSKLTQADPQPPQPAEEPAEPAAKPLESAQPPPEPAVGGKPTMPPEMPEVAAVVESKPGDSLR